MLNIIDHGLRDSALGISYPLMNINPQKRTTYRIYALENLMFVN